MNYKDIKIGDKNYLVHSKYIKENLNGGRILVCKVKSFQNYGGKIMPIYTEVGNSKHSPDLSVYKPFTDIENAIEAIKTK